MQSIAIVSNKPQKNDSFAARIDACDEVVRFSKCKGCGQNAGSKATIWVQRSDASYIGPQILDGHKRLLREILPGVHSAYIVGNYRDGNGKKWVRHDVSKMCQAYPYLAARIRPVDASALSWLYPGRHATVGFMFLYHVLHAGLFAGFDKLLVGFDFVGDFSDHNVIFEKVIIEGWVRRGYFEYIKET